jgi:hypothetical protein
MNATELFKKDGSASGVWHCGKCRIVHQSHPQADKCCAPVRCTVCGEECMAQGWASCSSCQEKARDAAETVRFRAAEKVPKWDGWVFLEGVGRMDGYFESVKDLLAHFHDDEMEPPHYAWTCDPVHFVRATLDDITNRICEDAYEDFDAEELRGLVELHLAIVAFNKLNKDKVSYSPNYTKAVLLFP